LAPKDIAGLSFLTVMRMLKNGHKKYDLISLTPLYNKNEGIEYQ